LCLFIYLLICTAAMLLPLRSNVRAAAAAAAAAAAGRNAASSRRKLATHRVRYQHHSLDLSEIVPGLVVMSQTRHHGTVKAYLFHKYGSATGGIHLFDLDATWVR